MHVNACLALGQRDGGFELKEFVVCIVYIEAYNKNPLFRYKRRKWARSVMTCLTSIRQKV